MARLVYFLCAVMSIVCALMLFRGYRNTRTKLLFWSSLCFAGLAINNVLLFIDLGVPTTADLSLWRSGVAAVAMLVLVYGLVMEMR